MFSVLEIWSLVLIRLDDLSNKSFWFLSINPICPAPLALLLSAYKYTLVCSGLGQVDLLLKGTCPCPGWKNHNNKRKHILFPLSLLINWRPRQRKKTWEDMCHTFNTFVTQIWKDWWKYHEVPSSTIWYKKRQIVNHQKVY